MNNNYYRSNYYASRYYASNYYRPSSVATPYAAPGPGRGQQYHPGESSAKNRKQKCRKKFQQALLLNDFDFIEAQRHVQCDIK